jgi:hypothetical protein
MIFDKSLIAHTHIYSQNNLNLNRSIILKNILI